MITSTKNRLVKFAKSLSDKKNRYENGLYLIEGERLVREAIRFQQQIKYILCSEPHDCDTDDLGFPVYMAKKFVVDSACDAVNGQGVVAVVKMSDLTVTPPRGKCLILDNLQDPGNLGAVMRTAAATGYDDVYLANCADAFSPKVVRSAMSAHFVLRIHRGELPEIFDAVKNKCRILCADMNGENVFKIKAEKNHAIVIGNEGNGVSEFSLSNCDKTVSLPMKNDFESLNAAVSAGVLMYELSNKED